MLEAVSFSLPGVKGSRSRRRVWVGNGGETIAGGSEMMSAQGPIPKAQRIHPDSHPLQPFNPRHRVTVNPRSGYTRDVRTIVTELRLYALSGTGGFVPGMLGLSARSAHVQV